MGKVRSSQNLPKTLPDLYVRTQVRQLLRNDLFFFSENGKLVEVGSCGSEGKKVFLDLIPVMSHGADFSPNILSPDLHLGNRSKCSIRRMCNFLLCATAHSVCKWVFNVASRLRPVIE